MAAGVAPETPRPEATRTNDLVSSTNRREGRREAVRGASGRLIDLRRVDPLQCVDLNEETMGTLKTELRVDRLKNDRPFLKLR